MATTTLKSEGAATGEPTVDEPVLSDAAFDAFRAEVVRAAGGMSGEQLLDLADCLHAILRLRRPGRPVRDASGWRAGEICSFL